LGVRDHRYGHGITSNYIETKKTNRGGERLLAFLKRQANVIGLYILSQNKLCYRKEYFARIKKMDSVKDGEA
jgi:hypothetical protein